MKIINAIPALLFALQASTATATGFAIDGTCDDFGIDTDQDCDDKCKSISKQERMGYSGSMKGPSSMITECSCTFGDGDGKFTCTRAKPEPEDPVETTEDCKERGIATWQDCQDTCSTLADGRGYAARFNGGTGNVSACYCDYGRNRENSFTCTRDATIPLIPQERDGRCSDKNIDDQDSCFAFCLEYQRSPQCVSNANGLLVCRCRRGQGGQIDFQCKGDQSSYLRSN
mmetsp:Transcript_1278/g.1767  ORF Transcript_1278/g.1767 Transcript_1278/m.1767 type:complete len:229 (-) Transcript_1278:189-875(-)|eukprot:CAMPEP_0201687590 /NCGR_PEP_ID=MMETSP0578-20130828/1582_1 /ASSEMBLY_ACC=CAM_ASM_000663 /TAXON_ID=267565 /ORGANISM="Skeletonema grethea, Strain CCMP 1804" /LENGTH=228 /DNA_ID=CAMNT_0048171753 /DNA_START=47 /DNA_END=733 /DNA_ORIENTATION=-